MPIHQEQRRTTSGNCPVCEALITPAEQVEESEILCCQECCSTLVVEEILPGCIVLGNAPLIEEDWGE